jgi:gamma-glutamylcyclotransferase (GGCT)/AIG2-like uncharacterized protein YtfP
MKPTYSYTPGDISRNIKAHNDKLQELADHAAKIQSTKQPATKQPATKQPATKQTTTKWTYAKAKKSTTTTPTQPAGMIIYNPDGRAIPDDVKASMKKSFLKGDFGCVLTDGKAWTVDRGKITEEMYELLTKGGQPFIARMYAFPTLNVQPVDMGNNRDMLFMHGNPCRTVGKNTDAVKTLAETLLGIPRRYWRGVVETVIDARVALVDLHRNRVKLANLDMWWEHEGVFYSDDSHLPGGDLYKTFHKPAVQPAAAKAITQGTTMFADKDYKAPEYGGRKIGYGANKHSLMSWGDNHLLAVYGTLRRGNGNHHLINEADTGDSVVVRPGFPKSDYIGTGLTADKYPMDAMGCPFVYDKPGIGNNIVVEVYRINAAGARYAIDGLENHPDWYRRRQVEVDIIEEGQAKRVRAWMYLIPERTMGTSTNIPSESRWISDFMDTKQKVKAHAATTTTTSETNNYDYNDIVLRLGDWDLTADDVLDVVNDRFPDEELYTEAEKAAIIRWFNANKDKMPDDDGVEEEEVILEVGELKLTDHDIQDIVDGDTEGFSEEEIAAVKQWYNELS